MRISDRPPKIALQQIMEAADAQQNQEAEQEDSSGWLTQLYEVAGLKGDESLAIIGEKMSDVANAAAPRARTSWIWVVALQSACVIAPAVWFIRDRAGIPAIIPAAVCFTIVLFMLGGLWWMRWRGMQKTWARARLVTEVARSLTKSKLGNRLNLLPFTSQIPELESLPEPEPFPDEDWETIRDHWTKERLEDQLAYYHKAKNTASERRSRLTRGITLSMDVTFCVSLFALLIFLTNQADRWRRSFGDYWLDWVIGILSLVLPLVFIALQVLRSVWELNRRTARFERQIRMLESTRASLENVQSDLEGIDIICQAEQQLLSEVIDWYFETETAEQFIQTRGLKDNEGYRGPEKLPLASESKTKGDDTFVGAMPGHRFILYTIRVFAGRLPWILGAIAFTLLWLNFKAAEDPVSRARLEAAGQLVNRNGEPWVPYRFNADNGCIILVHGLNDSAYRLISDPESNKEDQVEDDDDSGSELHWMEAMQRALEKEMIIERPNIGRVDWHVRAVPGLREKLLPMDNTVTRLTTGVAGIKPQGHEVGYFLAFRLAQFIDEGKIDRNAPFHLIGHSAGGFVVARAALFLDSMGLAPKNMRVTILDTPEPGKEILEELPKVCPVDFYVTSGYVLGVKQEKYPDIHIRKIDNEYPAISFAAHSYAYQWYTETIKDPEKYPDGFRLSPFLQASSEPPRQPALAK